MATTTILTPLMIAREGLRILHANLKAVKRANLQYDDRFARSGAKIGNLLNVRMPPKYTVGTGATVTAQNYVERSTPLYCSSQFNVAVSFTTADLSLSLDDFSGRFLKPAMAQLASHIEGSFLTSAYKWVANYTGTTSTQLTFKQFQQGGQWLTENLAPNSERTALLNPQSAVEFMDATKGLFHSSDRVREQYEEGMMGRTGGFDVFESTMNPSHTVGAYAGTPLTDGASQGTTNTSNVWASTTTIHVDGYTSGVQAAVAGDIITFSNVYEVHPETKVSTGRLKRFVVTADSATASQTGGDTDFVISPAMIYGVGNAYQNCSLVGGTTDGLTITHFGVASTSYGQNIQFHKDAFAFVTADLEDVSTMGAWGARDNMDGISMRIARQWAVGSDLATTRIDVLAGWAPLYPELAVRGFHSLT